MTDSAPFLRGSALAGLSGIRHAFFTRQGGVSGGIYASLNGGRGSRDEATAVLENRGRMARALGVDHDRLVTPYQIHSAEAVVALEPWSMADAPKADAVVTTCPGIAVGVAVADCGPVLLADAEAGVVAAAHAGWQGALSGILDSTLDRMEQAGARRDRVVAVLGPCIRQPSYEVGPEFVARFETADSANARFFAPAKRDGHAMFDLAGYVRFRLRAAGVGVVEDLALDTYADEERFYSYRRSTHRAEPDYGRLIAAIALES